MLLQNHVFQFGNIRRNPLRLKDLREYQNVDNDSHGGYTYVCWQLPALPLSCLLIAGFSDPIPWRDI